MEDHGKKGIIKVTCCLFPNGDIFRFETIKGDDYLKKVINKWKSTHQEYEGIGVDMAVAQIKMEFKDYIAIGATNESNEFFKNL